MNKGFSLVELMVALGAGALLSLAMMSINKNLSRNNKSIENDFTINQAFSQMKASLSTSDGCRSALRNLSPFPAGGFPIAIDDIRRGASYPRPNPNAPLTNFDAYWGYNSSDGGGDILFTSDPNNQVHADAHMYRIEDMMVTLLDSNVRADKDGGMAKYRLRVRVEIIDKGIQFGGRYKIKDFTLNTVYKVKPGVGPVIVNCSSLINESDKIVPNIVPRDIVDKDDVLMVLDNRPESSRVFNKWFSVFDASPDIGEFNVQEFARWFNDSNPSTNTQTAPDNNIELNNAANHSLLVGMSPRVSELPTPPAHQYIPRVQTGKAVFGFQDAFDPCEVVPYDYRDERERIGQVVTGFDRFTGQTICRSFDVEEDNSRQGTPNSVISLYAAGQSATMIQDGATISATAMCPRGQHVVGFNWNTLRFICRQDRKFLHEIVGSDASLLDSSAPGQFLMSKGAGDYEFVTIGCSGVEESVRGLNPDGTSDCITHSENQCPDGQYVSRVDENGVIECATRPGGVESEVSLGEYIVGVEDDGSASWMTRTFESCDVNQESYFDPSAPGWRCRDKLPQATRKTCASNEVMVGIDSTSAVICQPLSVTTHNSCTDNKLPDKITSSDICKTGDYDFLIYCGSQPSACLSTVCATPPCESFATMLAFFTNPLTPEGGDDIDISGGIGHTIKVIFNKDLSDFSFTTTCDRVGSSNSQSLFSSSDQTCIIGQNQSVTAASSDCTISIQDQSGASGNCEITLSSLAEGISYEIRVRF